MAVLGAFPGTECTPAGAQTTSSSLCGIRQGLSEKKESRETGKRQQPEAKTSSLLCPTPLLRARVALLRCSILVANFVFLTVIKLFFIIFEICVDNSQKWSLRCHPLGSGSGFGIVIHGFEAAVIYSLNNKLSPVFPG